MRLGCKHVGAWEGERGAKRGGRASGCAGNARRAGAREKAQRAGKSATGGGQPIKCRCKHSKGLVGGGRGAGRRIMSGVRSVAGSSSGRQAADQLQVQDAGGGQEGELGAG